MNKDSKMNQAEVFTGKLDMFKRNKIDLNFLLQLRFYRPNAL